MRISRNLGLQLVLLAALGACDKGAPPPPAKATPEPTKTVAPTPTPAVGQWVTHTSKEGGFTIQLPAEPKLKDETVGGIAYHEAEVAVPGRDVSISVTWSALPGVDVEVGDTEGMLDTAVAGLVKGAGGTVVGETKPVNIEHHPGRDFTVAATVDGKPSKFRVRLFAVHDTLFRVVVRTGEKEDYAADTEKLLASFALTPEFSAAHTEIVTFDWKPYTAPDGSFTAKFPVAAPRVTTETENGLEITTVVASAQQSYAVFLVGSFEVPAASAKQKPAQLFDTLRDGVAGATGALLVGKAEPAPLGKIPGEKFILESDGKLMHIEGRTYLIGKRLYFLQAQRPHNSTVAQTEFDTFFASFAPGKAK